MRVAFLSDIHANFPALCAALESASAHGAEAVVCAGDVAGGGPHPTEVVRLLREQCVPSVLGNVDRKVIELASFPKRRKAARDKKKNIQQAWAAEALGEAELSWLKALPENLSLTFAGADVRVVHGSPLADTDYIFPSLTPRALSAKLGTDRPAVLVCGHSHIPFARSVDGVLVMNCGSVGRPIDGDPRGSYALCQFAGAGRVSGRIVRFEYPVEAVTHDLKSRKLPRAAPEEYRRGVKS